MALSYVLNLEDIYFCFDIHLTNSYLEEATDGRTNTYPQHSAPTFLKLVRPENCRDAIFWSNLITNATRRSHQYLIPNSLHQLPFEVGATRKLQGCNFLVMALILYLEEATDGRTNTYPKHTAPTSFEVGATRKLQGCNFLVRSLFKFF